MEHFGWYSSVCLQFELGSHGRALTSAIVLEDVETAV